MGEKQTPFGRAAATIREIAASDYFQSDEFRRLQTVLRYLLIFGVLAYLVWRLSDIGWMAVLAALPATPLFYLIFAVRYCVLPGTELLIYQRLWRRDLRAHWPVFFRKRVYNFGVLDYSGEAYFFAWARSALKLRDKDVFAAIRDSNVMSAVSSNLMTVRFLAIFVWFGMAEALSVQTPNFWIYLAAAGFMAVFLTALIVTFRRYLIGVSRDVAIWLFTLHSGRMLLILLLLGAQWASALPDIPWTVWWMFLTANLVLNRLPFLPNKDLMFLGLSVGLAEYVEGPEAAVAAVFVAASALTQLTNLAVFGLTSFMERSGGPERDTKNS